ncbi:MAG: translation initiation factor IF-2, partial [Elusimicrobia bacterium]|nr:translation initiation factor IF-2 [Elusimicrobiota bacterium]
MKKVQKTSPPTSEPENPPKKKKIKTETAASKEKKETAAKPAKKTLKEGEKAPAKRVAKKTHATKSVHSKPAAEISAPSHPKPKEIPDIQEQITTLPKEADSVSAVPVKSAEPEILPAPEKPAEKPVIPNTAVVEVQAAAVTAPPKPKISINETITVKDLSQKMNLKVGDILMRLLKMGVRASLNQRLDVDTAILLSSEFGFDAEFVPVYSEEAMIHAEVDQPSDLQHRSPIVTVMGHVDHGKTSLLDAIREANVAEKEAGGITQHIGAYKVRIEKGNIVFLDTPGHEAFTAMRARGAQVTDLVVLVVAADDGVKPQTVEAIDHARAAGVPILVAINKIDLPQSKPERVKQELSQYGLSPEEWGGKTIFVEVSAKKRINIDKLLEMLLLESELLELKANPKRSAQGVVIEAKLDPQKGPVATVIVQKGTLRIGNMFVCGLTSGKVKALTDDHGHRILEAGPSTPVEVLGFSETSQLGDRIIVVGSEREAREIIEKRKSLSRDAVVEKKRHLSLEILSAVAKEGKIKELGLIVKADVQGSLEALKDSIERIESPEIRIKVIHTGVGGITESDVSLAAASDAIIIGFSVRPEPAGEELARREGVEIKSYRIIYEVIADIRASLSGLLEPEEKEVSVGRVEVREIFKTPAGKVAGCMVVQGKVNR